MELNSYIVQAITALMTMFPLVAQTKALVQLSHAPMVGIPNIMPKTCFVWISFVMLRTLPIVVRNLVHVACTIVEVVTFTSTELKTSLAKDTLAMLLIGRLVANQRHYAKAIAVHIHLPIDVMLQLHLAKTRFVQCMICMNVASKREHVLNTRVLMAMHTSTMLKTYIAMSKRMESATIQLWIDVVQQMACVTLTRVLQALCRHLAPKTFHALGGFALTKTRPGVAITWLIAFPPHAHLVIRTRCMI